MSKFYFPCFLFFMAMIFFSCTESDPAAQMDGKAANPPAPGFNEANSDQKAIAIADEVMQAMGGRKAWDHTRFIQWNFFGRRMLYWDKLTGDVRIESFPDSTIYLVNVHEVDGQVQRKGEAMTQPDSLAKYLKIGRDIWINDSYWLVMPFKLKDSGVSLKYMGQDTTAKGKSAEVLQLTFEGVGVTPENKYLVYVESDRKLVTQWAFYANADDEKPAFVTPWELYKKFGNIMLACDRGKYMLKDIAVYDFLPDAVFSSFEPLAIVENQ